MLSPPWYNGKNGPATEAADPVGVSGSLGFPHNVSDEFFPWDTVVVANLQGSDSAGVDELVGLVASNGQSVGDVHDVKDHWHGFKVQVFHGDSSLFNPDDIVCLSSYNYITYLKTGGSRICIIIVIIIISRFDVNRLLIKEFYR